MSHSLNVETHSPTVIDVEELKAEISRVALFLLNQPPENHLNLEVQVLKNLELNHPNYGEEKSEWINLRQPLSPSDELFVVRETRFLGYGIEFFYRFDEYWKEYGNKPLYRFSILKIRPEKDSICLLICTALIIAVANILSEEYICDATGLFQINSDLTPVQELLKLRVVENVSIDEALSLFYKKLPSKLW